jgi:[ribosomal protein S5]-alanine N-acetyltransferase
VLETSRLLMRPFVLDDAPALFRILGDPQVMRFSVGGPHQSPAATARWIEGVIRHQDKYGFSMSAVLSRDHSELIGKCGLAVLHDGRTEIGYRMRRDRWGVGYATEAARAWLDRGFRALGLTQIVAMIEEANDPSIRVARKIGMRVAGPEVFHGIPVIAYVAGSK